MDEVINQVRPVYSASQDALVPKTCKHCLQVKEIKQINLTVAVRMCYRCSTPLQQLDITDIEFFHRSYRDIKKDPTDWSQNIGSEDHELNLLKAGIKELELTVSNCEDSSDDDEQASSKKIGSLSSDQQNKSEDPLNFYQSHASCSNDVSADVWHSSALDELDAALEKLTNDRGNLQELPFSLEELFPTQVTLEKEISTTDLTQTMEAPGLLQEIAPDLLPPQNSVVSGHDCSTVLVKEAQMVLSPTLPAVIDNTAEIDVELKTNPQEPLLTKSFLELAPESINECFNSSSEAVDVEIMLEPNDEADRNFDNCPSPNVQIQSPRESKSMNCYHKFTSYFQPSSVKSVHEQVCICDDKLYQLPPLSDGEDENHCLEMRFPNLLLNVGNKKDIKEEDCENFILPTVIDKVIFSSVSHTGMNDKKKYSEAKSNFSQQIDISLNDISAEPVVQSPSEAENLCHSPSGILISVPATEDITPEMLESLSIDDLPIVIDCNEYPEAQVSPNQPQFEAVVKWAPNSGDVPMLTVEWGSNSSVDTHCPDVKSTTLNPIKDDLVTSELFVPSQSFTTVEETSPGISSYAEDRVNDNCCTQLSFNDQQVDETSSEFSPLDPPCIKNSSQMFNTRKEISGQHDSPPTELRKDCESEEFHELQSFTGAKFKPLSQRVSHHNNTMYKEKTCMNLMQAVQREVNLIELDLPKKKRMIN